LKQLNHGVEMSKSNNGAIHLKATEDISGEWLNAIRSAIASCSGNSGYSLVNLQIAVKDNRVIAYYPSTTKIHPKKIAGVKVTPEVAVALSAFMGLGRSSD
jgi:S1-C subfamily serine protease